MCLMQNAIISCVDAELVHLAPMQNVTNHALIQNVMIPCIAAVHTAAHESKNHHMRHDSAELTSAACKLAAFHSVSLCCSCTSSPALPSLAADSCLRNALSARSWACTKF